jgi:carbamoyl-phosphate synthase small subunit
MTHPPKKLVFENGEVFHGCGFGADVERVCEVVFNTSMVGYQEIFSDCSYNEQMVCMTYPLIGNYGLADEDYEARTPRMGGFIVREYNDSLANFRAAKTLSEEMEEHGIPGIEGVDTRRVTRMIRSQGAMRAILCNAACSDAAALKRLAAAPVPCSQVQSVSCKKRWYARAAGARYNVAAIDCGIKLGIVRSLAERRCNVNVLPYDTPWDEVLALAPDGLLLSNGPGNPEDAAEVVELAGRLAGCLPIFGICLGHQVLALALGASTYKLKFGHRGGNHPVKHLRTGRVEVTSQNHSYAVDEATLSGTGLQTTHLNLLDHTIEGLENPRLDIFSVQYHPESNPGPQDARGLFDRFVEMMDSYKSSGRKKQT